jgi:hypothetical protein
MDKIRFTRDYSGAATLGNFFEAGQEWCFDADQASQVINEGSAKLVETGAETLTPEGQPAPKAKAKTYHCRNPKRISTSPPNPLPMKRGGGEEGKK